MNARQLKRLRDAIVLVRQHFAGFDAKRGYALTPKKLAKLTPTRQKKLKQRVRELRREQSRPYKVVKAPRDAAARRALYKHTGAEKVRGRKTFIVHTAKPETTTIQLVGTKSRKRVREVRKVAGAEIEQQYFYFADYTKKLPRTMKDIRRVAAKMLKDMPPGYYVMLSKEFGHISVNMYRDELLGELERNWLKYDVAPDWKSADPRDRKESRRLAESLIGFAFVSTTRAGARRASAQRLSLRQRMQKASDSGKSIFRRKRRQ